MATALKNLTYELRQKQADLFWNHITLVVSVIINVEKMLKFLVRLQSEMGAAKRSDR